MSSLKARLAAGVLALNAGAWVTYAAVKEGQVDEEKAIRVIANIESLPALGNATAIPPLASSLPIKSFETSANSTESDCNCKDTNVTTNIVVTAPYAETAKPTENLLTISNAPAGTTVTEQKINSSSPTTTIRFLVGSPELSSGSQGEKDKSTSDSSKPQPQVEVGRSGSLGSVLDPTIENQELRTIQPHLSSSSVLSGQSPQDTDLHVEQATDLNIEVVREDGGVETLPEEDTMDFDEEKIDIKSALEKIDLDKLSWDAGNYYLPRYEPINENTDSEVSQHPLSDYLSRYLHDCRTKEAFVLCWFPHI